MPRELEQERYARDLLAARFGVHLRKLPEGDVPTADYELLADDVRAAVVEVKTVERTARTEANGWTVTQVGPATTHYTRKDNAPGRIATRTHDAATQLLRYTEPKILVFVNEESFADVLDLHEAIQGYLRYGTDETGYIVNIASTRIAEGRIRDERWRIDLYVWIDRHLKGVRGTTIPANGKPTPFVGDEGPRFRCTTESGYELARRFFGCPDMPKPTA